MQLCAGRHRQHDTDPMCIQHKFASPYPPLSPSIHLAPLLTPLFSFPSLVLSSPLYSCFHTTHSSTSFPTGIAGIAASFYARLTKNLFAATTGGTQPLCTSHEQLETNSPRSMRASLLLLPAVLASSAFAWGRETPSKPALDTVPPAESRRYDYKQSLKKPFMYNGAIPYWGQHGSMLMILGASLFFFFFFSLVLVDDVQTNTFRPCFSTHRLFCCPRLCPPRSFGPRPQGLCVAVKSERVQGVGGRVLLQGLWARPGWRQRAGLLVHTGAGYRRPCLWKQGYVEGSGRVYGHKRSSEPGVYSLITMVVWWWRRSYLYRNRVLLFFTPSSSPEAACNLNALASLS